MRFLKHLTRTRLLLHLVDVAPLDPAEEPVRAVRAIEHELHEFGADLPARERWLVLNKVDLMPEDERAAVCQDILRRLDWQGPYFTISALSGLGVRELSERIMAWLEQQAASEPAEPVGLEREDGEGGVE